MEKVMLLTAASQLMGDNKLSVAFLDPPTLFGTTRLHCHDYYEVFAIDSGNVGYHCNGADSIIHGGELIFAGPQDQHAFRATDSYNHFMNIVIRQDVSALFFQSLGGDALFGFLKSMDHRIHMEPSASIRLFQAGINYITFSEDEDLRAKRLLCMLGDIFLSAKLDYDKRLMPDWLNEVIRAYQTPDNFTQSISALYVMCARSPEYVCRCFRQYLGMTPTRFLNSKRLSYAKQLLASTDYSVLDISILSGFNSLSHFNHLFLREFSMTPLSLRKQFSNSVNPQLFS